MYVRFKQWYIKSCKNSKDNLLSLELETLKFATGRQNNYVSFPEKEWQEKEEKKGVEDKNPRRTTVLLTDVKKVEFLL